MTYVAIALVVLVFLLAWALLKHIERSEARMAAMQAAFNVERRELLNRLAQPGLVAIAPEQQVKPRPAPDMRDFRRIGTVQPPVKEPVDAA